MLGVDCPDDEDEDAFAARMGNELAARLTRALPAAWLDEAHADFDEQAWEVVDTFKSMRADDFCDDPSYSTAEHFDDVLQQLYDWADIKRVWIKSF